MTEPSWLADHLDRSLPEQAEDWGPLFSLKSLNGAGLDVRVIDTVGYTVLSHDGGWTKFAVLGFFAGTGEDEILSYVFHGEGASGYLRECRHTWWGEKGDGYVFYPNGKLIAGAFKVLSEFFDDMA